MVDYMLKFDSQEQAEQVLIAAHVMQVQQTVDGFTAVVAGPGQNVDVIGVIHKPDGTFTETEGMRFPNMVPIEGYHVNVRAPGAIDGLDSYAVFPATPVRVWA